MSKPLAQNKALINNFNHPNKAFGSLNPRYGEHRLNPDAPQFHVCVTTNHSASVNVIYFGAFFQFTATDRDAWNRLVQEDIMPKPSEGLGAIRGRRMYDKSHGNFLDAMPKAKFSIQNSPTMEFPPSYYFDDPVTAC